LAGDLKQMAADRWELARLEGREAVGPIRRLAIWLAVAAVVLLVGLSTLTAAAAAMLGDRLWTTAGWLLVFGLLLLAAAASGAYLAWRRFRRTFSGMEQTLEELREDLIWLAEKAGRADEEPLADDPADE